MPSGISQGRRRDDAEEGLRAFSAENDEQVGTENNEPPEGVGTAGGSLWARNRSSPQNTLQAHLSEASETRYGVIPRQSQTTIHRIGALTDPLEWEKCLKGVSLPKSLRLKHRPDQEWRVTTHTNRYTRGQPNVLAVSYEPAKLELGK